MHGTFLTTITAVNYLLYGWYVCIAALELYVNAEIKKQLRELFNLNKGHWNEKKNATEHRE